MNIKKSIQKEKKRNDRESICGWKKKAWIGLHIVHRKRGSGVSYTTSICSDEYKKVLNVYEKTEG